MLSTEKVSFCVVLAIAGCGSSPDVASGGGAFGGSGPISEGGVGAAGFGGGPAGGIPLPVGTTQAEVAPPPISGGTLRVLADGRTAVAADPDRDQVYAVDLVEQRLLATIALEPGDEPGRLAEDAAGRVHVALRGGGSIVTIDPLGEGLVARRPVCAAPRGIAFDAALDALHVACDTGELVTIGTDAAEPARVLQLGRDLRDVLVDGSRLLVSRFRSAELLAIEGDSIQNVVRPGDALETSIATGVLQAFEPAVAWRTIENPKGGALMLHQMGLVDPVSTIEPGGYSGGCFGDGIVRTTVAQIGADTGARPSRSIPNVSLATDLAVSSDGDLLALAVPGNAHIGSSGVVVIGTPEVDQPQTAPCDMVQAPVFVPGEAVSVAFEPSGGVVVQSRQPAQLQVVRQGLIVATIPLSDLDRTDTGHALFHAAASGGIACASCHPEGRDDHRTWNFETIGPRRTQSLGGGLMATAPFHWDGDMVDFSTLVHEVFVNRMGGFLPSDLQTRLFSEWLDELPAPSVAASVDAAAIARGEALFHDPEVACATCHSGEKLTNNLWADVGTGVNAQVPTLIGIAARAPYMHDGCAATLHDRFGDCGGGDRHGKTSHLTPTQIDDLVAYLESL